MNVILSLTTSYALAFHNKDNENLIRIFRKIPKRDRFKLLEAACILVRSNRLAAKPQRAAA
jgi:hypothetical protein